MRLSSSTSFSGTGPSSTGISKYPSAHSLPPGIIGVMVAGVVTLILAITIISLLIRRRRRTSTSGPGQPGSSLRPFVLSSLSLLLSNSLSSAAQLPEDFGSSQKHRLATYHASKRMADGRMATNMEDGPGGTTAESSLSQERGNVHHSICLEAAPPDYSETFAR